MSFNPILPGGDEHEFSFDISSFDPEQFQAYNEGAFDFDYIGTRTGVEDSSQIIWDNVIPGNNNNGEASTSAAAQPKLKRRAPDEEPGGGSSSKKQKTSADAPDKDAPSR